MVFLLKGSQSVGWKVRQSVALTGTTAGTVPALAMTQDLYCKSLKCKDKCLLMQDAVGAVGDRLKREVVGCIQQHECLLFGRSQHMPAAMYAWMAADTQCRLQYRLCRNICELHKVNLNLQEPHLSESM